MKAIVRTVYGSPDVLHLADVPTPAPTGDQVLIKICAVSLNRSDWEGLQGKPLYARMGGLRKPGYPILGSDIAGQVEQVGRNVTLFQPGDEVFGELPGYYGGFAEYACAPEKTLALKPPWLTFEAAATLPQAGAIAIHGIRTVGKVQPGQKVLINGAGGGAGVFAVQLAKKSGAEVTGVDNSHKQDFLRSLGADHVIDYARQDFTRSGAQYDLILDLIAQRSVFAYRRALRPGGTYYFVGGSVTILFQILIFGPWIKRLNHRHVRILAVGQDRKALLAVLELLEAGQLVPVIDKTFPFHAIPVALRYLGEGYAKGKVVITVASASPAG